MASGMMVTKRDGTLAPVSFDKITERVAKLCWDLNPDYIDPVKIAQSVITGVYNGVTTSELDRLTAETGAFFAHLSAQCASSPPRTTASLALTSLSLVSLAHTHSLLLLSHQPPTPRPGTQTLTSSRRASRSPTCRR
jgi:hypothetical protein